MNSLNFPKLLQYAYKKECWKKIGDAMLFRNGEPDEVTMENRIFDESRKLIEGMEEPPNTIVYKKLGLQLDYKKVIQDPPEMLDIPFDACIFECMDASMLDIPSGVLRSDDSSSIESVLVLEALSGYAFLVVDSNGLTYSIFEPECDAHKLLRGLIQEICNFLNSKNAQIGEVAHRERVKSKMHGTTKIKSIVVVTQKKYKSSIESEFHRTVDWSHGFERRGHWVTVKNIGKNRKGDYCIPGRTWRVAHTVNPNNKKVVKKTRVFTGGEYEQLTENTN